MVIEKLHQEGVEDFQTLIGIFHQVFESDLPMPSSDYLKAILSRPDIWIIAVKVEGRVVGGLSIHLLHSYYIEKQVAYIYDLGIHPDHQGKGMGMALISYVKAFCKQKDIPEAYVEAEQDDEMAVNFYRRTFPDREQNTIQFTYSF